MPRPKKPLELSTEELDKLPGHASDELAAALSALNVATTHPLLLLTEQIDEIMNSLSQKERRVLQMGFGLLDGKSRTTEQIAAELKLSPEEVRDIEESALRKLRSPNKAKKLSEYLDA